MSEALAAVFPATTLQTCIVHLMRHSLDFANWKERKPLAAALRPIYTARERGGRRRGPRRSLSGARGARSFPTVVASWRRAWTHVIPFFAFPPEVRRVHLHDERARERARAAAQDHQDARPLSRRDEAATKLIWLALRNITAKWARGPTHWQPAMNQFAILYEIASRSRPCNDEPPTHGIPDTPSVAVPVGAPTTGNRDTSRHLRTQTPT